MSFIRITTIQDCDFLEVASTAVGAGENVVRIDDDYDRGTIYGDKG